MPNSNKVAHCDANEMEVEIHQLKVKEEEEEEQQQQPGDLEVYLEDEFEELVQTAGGMAAQQLSSAHAFVTQQLSKAVPVLKRLLAAVMLIAFALYLGFAMFCERLSTDGSIRLLSITCIAVALAAVRQVSKSKRVTNSVLPLKQRLQQLQQQHTTAISVIGTVAFFAYFLGFVIVIGSQDTRNLVSAIGVAAILLLALILSAHPTRVNWRPVMGGLTLQITFAALLMRTEPGFLSFKYLADRVAEFIQHVDSGCEFVFGETFRDHYFAFSVLSVIVFFSSFISLMFHLGILQSIISIIGKAMQLILGTTAGESLVAAANIFIGQTEAPLMIRPFVGRLTNSELHAVITSGYATIAGGVLAAYIGLGVPPQHLLSASVMAAPGALALSKIMYPETKKSKTGSDSLGKIQMGTYHNAIDAIASGAIDSISIVAAIAANLISFITMLTFLNTALTWLGNRVCLGVDLTFELICGYVLWPVAFVMGVTPVDCSNVAELIGTKFFINEFVAYNRFNVFRKNHLELMAINRTDYFYNRTHLWFPDTNTTLVGGTLFESRSLTLVTYALCGFANIGSIGMQLGVFCVMMPRRKTEVVGLVLRGVITGTLANLMTASVAGIFYQDEM